LSYKDAAISNSGHRSVPVIQGYLHPVQQSMPHRYVECFFHWCIRFINWLQR